MDDTVLEWRNYPTIGTQDARTIPDAMQPPLAYPTRCFDQVATLKGLPGFGRAPQRSKTARTDFNLNHDGCVNLNECLQW